MEYVFKDREDLKDVQGLKDKIHACVDMIAIYGESLGHSRESITPDTVIISTGVNARALQCLFKKDGTTVYILVLTQMYGFGATFWCESDMHDAALRAVAYATDVATKLKGKKSIKFGGAE